MYNIEPLKQEDVEKCVSACIEYAREMGEPYQKEYIRKMLSRYSDGSLPVLVAKNESGEVMGMSAFVCVPHLYNPDIIQARELIWHTSPKMGKFSRVKLQKRLLKIMMATCEQENISLYVSADKLGEMLIAEGFKEKNVLYVKEAE